MITMSGLFDRLDHFLEKLPGRKNLNPQDEVQKKYMITQGILAITFLIAFGIVGWSIEAKMIVEFSEVYLVIMTFAMLFFFTARKTSDFILVFKIVMIVVSSVYIIRMGGLHTSGGLFLLAIQAVTSTIILRNSRRILMVASTFVIFMIILIAFQSRFPTEYALSAKQNNVIIAMSLLGVTSYIFFFSLYAVNLLTKMEQHETQRQKELNEAKTRLYTNITHEFRTPLTVIIGLADSLKNKMQENIPGKMDTIIKNGKNLLQLVDQMLDLSKLESGNLRVNKIYGNIIPFLRYIFQLQEYYAKDKNIKMSFHTENPNYELDFDPEKTTAIISNLLTNAIKFTPAGGEVSMNVRTMSNNLIIEVRDNGIGIPKEKLDKVFDRFYQVDDSNTRKVAGTGIGLSLTMELVNLLNGSIDVFSKAGVETIFTVRLPLTSALKYEKSIPVKSAKLQLEEASTDISHFDKELEVTEKQTLLIVEDNDDVVDYIKTCYQEHFSILIAKNGVEGHRMALEEIPNIIISDVMMPEMDGFELCKLLKEDFRTSHIPIILLTAKADIPSRIEGLEQGADAYIVKPFNQRELLVRMQKLLELRRNLFRRYSNGNGLDFSNDPVIQREDQFINKLNEIIQKNLGDENFNIQVLCSEMAMSKSQLYRKFKALTNKSAAKYIRTLRMKKAKELLQTTSMNIAEVGYEVGMKTPSTFSELFKEEFGESPREFVNHFQKESL